MKNSSLIELLTCLTETEWQLLEGKLASSSIAAAVRELYGYLLASRPIDDNKSLDKTTVYKAIFKNQPYNDQRLRDAMSALAALAKDVITEAELSAHPYQLQLLQVKALRKRGLSQSYERAFNKTVKESSLESANTEDALLYQYQLAQEREEYFALQQDRQPDQALQDRMDALDRFYILAKLKLTCEQLNRMHILQAEYQPVMLREIMALLDANLIYLLHSGILVYFRVLQMLSKPTEPYHYHQLVQDLTNHEYQLEKEEARNLYRYAQNYCIRMINQGSAGYFRQLLDLYQKQLNNKLLLPDGVLDHTDYKNIVTVGLRLKDYQWTGNFIAQYKDCLPDSVREAAWLYNQANYLYEIGKLTEAGNMLVKQNFADFYYNLSARHLLLKIFYDEQETDALTYQIESFRLYLLRNKTISTANRTSNLNFLKVMKNLATLKQRQEYAPEAQLKAKLGKIEHAIGHYQPLANKNWLLEQVNSIKAVVLK